MSAGQVYIDTVKNFKGAPEQVNCQILITFAAQQVFTDDWEEKMQKVADNKKKLEKQQGLV